MQIDLIADNGCCNGRVSLMLACERRECIVGLLGGDGLLVDPTRRAGGRLDAQEAAAAL